MGDNADRRRWDAAGLENLGDNGVDPVFLFWCKWCGERWGCAKDGHQDEESVLFHGLGSSVCRLDKYGQTTMALP